MTHQFPIECRDAKFALSLCHGFHRCFEEKTRVWKLQRNGNEIFFHFG